MMDVDITSLQTLIGTSGPRTFEDSGAETGCAIDYKEQLAASYLHLISFVAMNPHMAREILFASNDCLTNFTLNGALFRLRDCGKSWINYDRKANRPSTMMLRGAFFVNNGDVFDTLVQYAHTQVTYRGREHCMIE